ncbi:MAG: HAMP domain-containing histidine kinase [Ruminococcus sp.]|nr:HAMP domain-containing histidine kinase [Ruminococcus sp.]
MKVLADQKVKGLLLRILLCVSALVLCLAGMAFFQIKEAAVYGVFLAAAAGIVISIVCYQYFRKQNEMLEAAAGQIREYIAGDREARIACDEEGEMYRLFHEVNSLAAILNAKAVKEEQTRQFLQNTISDISHQLKTPLAALNIYNGILQTEAESGELTTIQEFSDLSEQELERIETLVQNLLKIAKFDAGTIVIEKKPENVADMMAEVKKRFAFRAKQEGKEILLAGSGGLTFPCDRSWMIEALDNIVKNALDHTGPEDKIQITWGESASAVRIVIKDSGSGIHPEDLHHIFKRFYRSRYSKDTQGIGLGLPLAKSVVEAHNGTIEVDSSLGEGTAFIMNFLRETVR